ncbi:MAG TPA: histidine kinase [Thermoanaerobaculia bacterium]|nr:histidine kinase [Thermoanaerobaculia bacterium]
MHTRSRITPRELLIIFLVWTSLALFTVANRLIDPRGEGLRVMRTVGPLAFPFVEAWLWAVLTPLILLLASRTTEPMHWLLRVLVLVAAGILISMTVDVVLEVTRVELFEIRRFRGSSLRPFRGIGRFRFVNQLVVYAGVLAAGFAREYFLREQRGRVSSMELQTRTAQLEAQLAHARLDALRMQINPHFLFNTMNAISALVERDPRGVRRMIARLSELLRETLDRRAEEELPLRDELDFLQRYLDIMAVRFQGKLTVTREIADDTLDVRVPSFILQPLVENALEHGVSRSGDARVTLGARRDGAQLVFTVHDDGPGLAGNMDEPGVGLANTRARLSALYGEAASLSVVTAAEGGATAEIRLPWRT